jgi:hypothetical protein
VGNPGGMHSNPSRGIARLFRVKEGVNVPISCRRRSFWIIHSQLRILDD